MVLYRLSGSSAVIEAAVSTLSIAIPCVIQHMCFNTVLNNSKQQLRTCNCTCFVDNSFSIEYD